MSKPYPSALEMALADNAEDVLAALNAARQALRAILARIDGEFDQADLMAFGPLSPSATDDCRAIAADSFPVVQAVCEVIDAEI